MYVVYHPIHLLLIFEISSLKIQDWRSLFSVHFKLDVYCLCSLQKSILKFVCRTWFLQLNFSKIKCRSTGGKSVIRYVGWSFQKNSAVNQKKYWKIPTITFLYMYIFGKWLLPIDYGKRQEFSVFWQTGWMEKVSTRSLFEI